MKQNITLTLDRDLIRRAKVLAASRDTSVSQLLSDKLEQIVLEEERYQQAKRSALADLEAGFHLGGAGLTSRDALHER